MFLSLVNVGDTLSDVMRLTFFDVTVAFAAFAAEM